MLIAALNFLDFNMKVRIKKKITEADDKHYDQEYLNLQKALKKKKNRKKQDRTTKVRLTL